MNERIRQLLKQAELDVILNQHASEYGNGYMENTPYPEIEKFAELIKQAIYDKVKEELIEDEVIDSEPAYFRKYLKGCNSGIVDALCIIKNFGVE